MSRAAQRVEARKEELPLAEVWSGAKLARWLAAAWGLIILVGMAALRLPGATVAGNELSFERCVFTSVNAATLTGFQQSVALDQFGWLGQAIVLVLVVAAANFALIIGGLGLTRALRLKYTPNDIVQTALLVYIFSLGIGTSILLDRNRGLLPSASQATGRTLKPAMTALAGLVPWALVGIRQTLRCLSLRDSW